MTRPFTQGDSTTGALLGWWRGLEQYRGDRAELRRCAGLLQVMQTEAFHAVRRRLIAAGMSESDSRNPRLAAIVALAAHAKGLSDESLPAAFSSGDKPPVSPLRLRQILDSADDDELFTRLRRVLPLIDGHVNLPALAANVWYWGDAVRKRWVYDYHWPAKQSA
ncbi:MAG: type I-E CRISPR-associated protein Cse2/CasB [Burkholderiales bacterium]